MDPVDSLLGILAISAGILILYGAVKNKRVFGQDGILSQAISTGSITGLNPAEVTAPIGTEYEPFQRGGQKRAVLPSTPVLDAIGSIAASDPGLAAKITTEVEQIRANSTLDDLTPLAQLLALADGKGFTAQTKVIKEYVSEVTNESL